MITAPTGWTSIGTQVSNGSAITQRSFWHVTQAPASEPTSYAFKLSAQKPSAAGMVAFSGVRAANPIQTAASASGKSVSASAPAVSATYATRRIVAATFVDTAPLSFSAAVTERWERPSGANEHRGGRGRGAGGTDRTGHRRRHRRE